VVNVIVMKPGEIIKQMRTSRNLTQTQLAEKAGVTRARISALEKADNINFVTFTELIDLMDFKLFAVPKEEFSPITGLIDASQS
jgi:transcriptional regulator with XRE-family HTH domain